MSRMGKMVSKDSSFIKEYYQDESGKIWYREDWPGKEFTATGYLNAGGRQLCEKDGTEWYSAPCVDFRRSGVDLKKELRDSLKDIMSNDEIESIIKSFFNQDLHNHPEKIQLLPASVVLQGMDSSPLMYDLIKIKFLTPRHGSNELSQRNF